MYLGRCRFIIINHLQYGDFSRHNYEGNMSTIWKIKGLFLLAAGVSFLLSVYLWFNGYKDQGVYVGLWVPSILSSGALMLAGEGKKHE